MISNLESRIKTIRNAVALLGLVGNIIGVIIIFWYCITYQFYPVGISVGDVLFCMYIFVIFGFLCFIFIFQQYMAGRIFLILFPKPINKCFNKCFNKCNLRPIILPKEKIYIFLSIIANLFCLSLIFYSWFQTRSLFKTLISFIANYGAVLILIGFCIFNQKWNTLFKINQLKPSAKNINILYFKIGKIEIPSKLIIIIYSLILLLFCVNNIMISLTDITLTLAGVRQAAVTIYIDKNYQKLLQSRIAKITKNSALNSEFKCFELCYIENVNILFSGIGTETLLEIKTPKDKQGQQQALLISLPSSAIKGKEQIH
ncbi:hypothetical protein [Snodgrassella alvi]|uniref:hypothetical protein n=1 Tax=Snodgrassella alvi TaxID=1196083 RepID=UPI003510E15C